MCSFTVVRAHTAPGAVPGRLRASGSAVISAGGAAVVHRRGPAEIRRTAGKCPGTAFGPLRTPCAGVQRHPVPFPAAGSVRPAPVAQLTPHRCRLLPHPSASASRIKMSGLPPEAAPS